MLHIRFATRKHYLHGGKSFT